MQCILKYRHCSINFTLSLSFSELKNHQKLQKAPKGRWDGETLFTKWPELKKKNMLAGLGNLTGWGPALAELIKDVSNTVEFLIICTPY